MDERRVSLRPTRPEEVDAVVAWERDLEAAAFVEAWSSERHRSSLDDPDLAHRIVEFDGRPVGFVLLAGLGGTRPIVEFKRIVGGERGRGIGTAAVREGCASPSRNSMRGKCGSTSFRTTSAQRTST